MYIYVLYWRLSVLFFNISILCSFENDSPVTNSNRILLKWGFLWAHFLIEIFFCVLQKLFLISLAVISAVSADVSHLASSGYGYPQPNPTFQEAQSQQVSRPLPPPPPPQPQPQQQYLPPQVIVN